MISMEGTLSRRHGSLPEPCLTSEIPPAEDLSLRELEFIGFAPALTADLKYNESITNAPPYIPQRTDYCCRRRRCVRGCRLSSCPGQRRRHASHAHGVR